MAMTSVVGIDLGNYKSVVAVARNKGVDIICNEVSNRATPTLVSFGHRQRYLGEAAKTNEISNFKNTISCIKRLLGRTSVDPREFPYISKNLQQNGENIQFKVDYNGSSTFFNCTQLVGMYLTQLRQTANKEIGSMVDCVISVPAYYSDHQRRALLDASHIAGLNCLKIVNEHTAVAITYGLPKFDLGSNGTRNVIFLDMGHSATTVSLATFTKNKLSVMKVLVEPFLGGRDFDQILVNHFTKEFKTNYKLDVTSDPKAMIRLRAACEKVKKILSANSTSQLNIESLMNDKDVRGQLNRSAFEELVEPLLERLRHLLSSVIPLTGVNAKDIHSIELIGGSTRVPIVRETVSKAFPVIDIMTTLNQEEAVAKGCAFQCAILSPSFQVREYQIEDVITEAIQLEWDEQVEEEQKALTAFEEFHFFPSKKRLNFYRSNDFVISMDYVKSIHGIPSQIGEFKVTGLNGTRQQVKLIASIDMNGIANIDSAYVLLPDHNSPEETNKEEKNEKLEEGREIPQPETEKGQKKHKVFLAVSAKTSSLSSEELKHYRDLENQMINNDKRIVETENVKNALEEYIYDMKSKLEGPLSIYCEKQAVESFIEKLSESENWLYEEGTDVSKEAYSEKLEKLQRDGDVYINRQNEYEKIYSILESVTEMINRSEHSIQQESSLTEAEKSVLEIGSKLREKLSLFSTCDKKKDPPYNSSEISKLTENLKKKLLVMEKERAEKLKQKSAAANENVQKEAMDMDVEN